MVGMARRKHGGKVATPTEPQARRATESELFENWNTGGKVICCPAPKCGVPFNPWLDYKYWPPQVVRVAREFCRPACRARYNRAVAAHAAAQQRIRDEEARWLKLGQLSLFAA